jgi:hypothetical protein
MDEDGGSILPPLDGKVQVRFGPDAKTLPTNMILNMERLKLETPGEYSIHLAIDGRQEKSLPLYLRLREGGEVEESEVK